MSCHSTIKWVAAGLATIMAGCTDAPTHPLQPADRGLSLPVVFQPHLQLLLRLGLDRLVPGEVSLCRQELDDRLPLLGRVDLGLLVAGAHRVADVRQQVGNRIAGLHLFTTSP